MSPVPSFRHIIPNPTLHCIFCTRRCISSRAGRRVVVCNCIRIARVSRRSIQSSPVQCSAVQSTRSLQTHAARSIHADAAVPCRASFPKHAPCCLLYNCLVPAMAPADRRCKYAQSSAMHAASLQTCNAIDPTGGPEAMRADVQCAGGSHLSSRPPHFMLLIETEHLQVLLLA